MISAIRARVPLRIGFGGGGTDIPPYCDEYGGVVLNATINRHAYATIVPNQDCFNISSLDYDTSISYGIEDPFIYNGQLDLAKAILDYFRQNYVFEKGIDVFLHNEAPPGTGLGSSSAITVALIGAVAEFLHLSFDSYEIAELAYKIERVDRNSMGGKQDQYTAAFGGFNFMEFHKDITVVNSLRLRPEVLYELEYNLVFAYVGGQRLSAHLIEKQMNNYREGNVGTITALGSLKDLAYQMKSSLLRGKLNEFGTLLHESWTAKQRVAEGIGNPRISEIYNKALESGAIGGKITGAGGGGFMFFYCDKYKRFAVQEALSSAGAQVVNFNFVDEGLRVWRFQG